MSTVDEEKAITMEIMDIIKMLPHRYPFLLIDRITELVPGKYVKGYKNITVNEPCFTGHFPENPIMPGVLIVEAMAQLSISILLTQPEYKGRLGLFAGIDGVRFKKMVVPGDKLEMTAEIVKMRGPVAKCKCAAYVDGKLVTEADLMCSIQ